MLLADLLLTKDPMPLATAVIALLNLAVAGYLGTVFLRNHRELKSKLTARMTAVGGSMVAYNGAFVGMFLSLPALWSGSICLALLVISLVQLLGLGLLAIVVSE